MRMIHLLFLQKRPILHQLQQSSLNQLNKPQKKIFLKMMMTASQWKKHQQKLQQKIKRTSSMILIDIYNSLMSIP